MWPQTHTYTLIPIGCLVFQSVHNWLKNTESQLGIGRLSRLSILIVAQSPERSRLNLLGDDVEDDVLVASPHHCSQCVVPLYGGAYITGRGDSLAIDTDDDIALLQASSVTKQEEWNLTNIKKYKNKFQMFAVCSGHHIKASLRIVFSRVTMTYQVDEAIDYWLIQIGIALLQFLPVTTRCSKEF